MLRIQSKGTLKPEQQQFESWIRASQLGATKKSVVRVSGYYEDRPENISTQRRREEWKPPSSVPQAGKMASNKENSNQGIDNVISENHGAHMSTAPQSNSVPNFQDHRNKGDLFSQQLKEIDKDLGIY
nr:hypothetical protein CFP56_76192 [Quercus suber]